MVSLIEGISLPPGFNIQKRKRLFDEEGVPVAELDIVISGTVGSGKLTFLIECRDRPNEHPAPASWIEQLSGRRSRFHLDKVMAVSSTGFSKPAISAARKLNIELRTFHEISTNDISAWIPQFAPMVARHGTYTDSCILVNHKVIASKNLEELNSFPLVILDNSDTEVTILQIWNTIISQESAWNDVPFGSSPVHKILFCNEYITEKYFVNSGGIIIPVSDIRFVAEMKQFSIPFPLTKAFQYSPPTCDSGDHVPFAQVYEWSGNSDAFTVRLMVIGHTNH